MKSRLEFKSRFSIPLLQHNILKWNMTSCQLLIEGTKKALGENCSYRMICFRVQYNKWGEGFGERFKSDMFKGY